MNFFSLPEIPDEFFAKTESILRNFMDKELRVEDVEDISIERAHRVGKPRSDGKPRPIIAKFSFFEDKSYVLSKAPTLAGINLTFQKKLLTSGNRLYHIYEMIELNVDARRSWCTRSCTLTVSSFKEANE